MESLASHVSSFSSQAEILWVFSCSLCIPFYYCLLSYCSSSDFRYYIERNERVDVIGVFPDLTGYALSFSPFVIMLPMVHDRWPLLCWGMFTLSLASPWLLSWRNVEVYPRPLLYLFRWSYDLCFWCDEVYLSINIYWILYIIIII